MTDSEKHSFIWTSRPHLKAMSLGLVLATMLLLFFFQHQYYTQQYGQKDIKSFEKVLHTKQLLIRAEFDEVLAAAEDVDILEVLDARSSEYRKLAQDEGIYFFFFQNGRLVYWSDHSVPLRNRWNRRLNGTVIEMQNATYLSEQHPLEGAVLMALILVKSDYPYENEYLKSGYQKDFKFNSEVEISRVSGEGLFDVTSLYGDYLFSFDFAGTLKQNKALVILSLILMLISIGALFVFFVLLIDSRPTRKGRTLWMSVGIFTFIFLAIFTSWLKVPVIIFESQLFKPEIFATLIFPSLGHLLIATIVLLNTTLLAYWYFDKSQSIAEKFYLPLKIFLICLAALVFIYMHRLVEMLVLDSNISFTAYKINTLSLYTFIGLLILASVFLVFSLCIDKALRYSKVKKWRNELLINSLIGLIICIPFLIQDVWSIEYYTPFFFILFMGSMIYLRANDSQRLKFSRYFMVLLFFALYLTVELQEHSEQKLADQKEIELAKLSSEHDAVAEMLFTDISDRLQKDSLLIHRLSFEILDLDLLLDYLQRNYFSGYWSKYELSITLCAPTDSVKLETGESYHCYDYFDEHIYGEGLAVENSSFYFLNNLNGRISYLAKFPYTFPDIELSLILELNSKIISEELGYPELLLSEQKRKHNSFSYAKYNNGKLITNGGKYVYRRTSDFYTSSEHTFETFRSEGYNHSIFNIDPFNTVIVSSPVVTLADRMISFSYTFAFVLGLFALMFLIISASNLHRSIVWDFKNKIQYSVIGILFFSFVVICAGTIYFVIQQYQIKHRDNLQNTMRSLYIELLHKVEYEEDIRNWSSESYYNLDELLRKFSNVFYTDINMYDEKGLLLATSRAEIFNQEFMSPRMNRVAFEKLAQENYSAYIQTERIGSMRYQSAYTALLNSDNEFLAYLNLPYFTQPEVLGQEVSNLVIAILNTYVILLLLILSFSVILADRITQPLRFLQNRIAQISLNKTNEKIVYKGRDEIRGLVEEYNSMVEEIVKSADLLAQSERESAWREMAKQIAHEIKNPLTPMKLNVQHMQRLIAEGKENIEEQVEKVSHALIEQIDSLTSIANEFSDFAKMPVARNKDVDILEKLHNIVTLFERTAALKIELDIGSLSKLHTFGDGEQFQRVIINLVKNGIQSIPEGRPKEIRITLEEDDDMAIIAVSDNGKGIDPSIHDKLFRPNFTTKSAGMGMGLAISANIVKAMGGSIWYETEEGIGTTFYVKVPVIE